MLLLAIFHDFNRFNYEGMKSYPNAQTEHSILNRILCINTNTHSIAIGIMSHELNDDVYVAYVNEGKKSIYHSHKSIRTIWFGDGLYYNHATSTWWAPFICAYTSLYICFLIIAQHSIRKHPFKFHKSTLNVWFIWIINCPYTSNGINIEHTIHNLMTSTK